MKYTDILKVLKEANSYHEFLIRKDTDFIKRYEEIWYKIKILLGQRIITSQMNIVINT